MRGKLGGRATARYAALALLAGGAPAAAQAPIAYTPAQLACAAFREVSVAEVRPDPGRPLQAGRAGVIEVRAAPADRAMAIELWYDSLLVWRRQDDREVRPDTDGFLGGRYRGWLDPRGGYEPDAVPFVPDELAALADLRTVPADLFPRLPDRALSPGEEWVASGTTVARDRDSLVAGVPLQRYSVTARRSRTEPREVGASGASVDLRIREQEEGGFVWHPERGLLRRERFITIESEVAAGGAVRRAMRSRAEERVVLERIPSAGCP